MIMSGMKKPQMFIDKCVYKQDEWNETTCPKAQEQKGETIPDTDQGGGRAIKIIQIPKLY